MTGKEDMRILLVEDSPADARLIRELLKPALGDGSLAHRESLAEACAALSTQPFDIVLLDPGLPDSQGIETVDRLLPHAGGLPVVVLTGRDDEAFALQTMRHGAADYLLKGKFNGELLIRTLRYAIERKAAEQELIAAESHFRRLVEQSLVGIYVIQDGGYAYVNPRMAEILGYPEARLTYGSLLEFVHPEDRGQVARNIERHLGGEMESLRYEHRMLRGAGREARCSMGPMNV